MECLFFIKKIGKIPENGVIRKPIHEDCEFMSPIFFEKPPRSFRQILNLERLNKFLLHMHFKDGDSEFNLRDGDSKFNLRDGDSKFNLTMIIPDFYMVKMASKKLVMLFRICQSIKNI